MRQNDRISYQKGLYSSHGCYFRYMQGLLKQNQLDEFLASASSGSVIEPTPGPQTFHQLIYGPHVESLHYSILNTRIPA